jgi:hypothetical protein
MWGSRLASPARRALRDFNRDEQGESCHRPSPGQRLRPCATEGDNLGMLAGSPCRLRASGKTGSWRQADWASWPEAGRWWAVAAYGSRSGQT